MTKSEMTIEELRKAARNHDNIYNEEADGYNPYTVEIEDRARTAEARRPITRSERKDHLLKEISSLDCSIARESGTFDADAVAALRTEYKALNQEEKDEFAAEWTREETISRREEWNNRVRSGQFGKCGGGKTDFEKVARQEEEQGWTNGELKQAVKLHNLPKAGN